MNNFWIEFSPEDIATLADVNDEAVWAAMCEDQMLRTQIMQLVAERYSEIAQDIEDDGEDDEEIDESGDGNGQLD